MAAVILLVPASSAWANGKVNVSVIGGGSGSVTSSSVQLFLGGPLGPPTLVPGEIDCDEVGGPVCSMEASNNFFGSEVRSTLTATPSGGAQFVGWIVSFQGSGGAVFQGCQSPPGTPSTCALNLNNAVAAELTATVTAVFTLPPSTTSNLEVVKAGAGAGTVTSAPAGIGCGAACAQDFLTGSTVTLSAVANPGSGFAGWSGVSGCAGTEPCSIELQEDTEVTATFHRVPVASTGVAGPGAAEYLRSLQGTVDPNESELEDCRFLYGPSSEYGESAPCDQSPAEIGAGDEAVAVTATTEPLDYDTVYHYRLRVTKAGGAVAQGKDRTFTTGPAPADSCANAAIRAEQGIEVQLLPDCMALEQVSPPKKGNQLARRPARVSADGNRIAYEALASLGDSPNFGGDQFLALRGPSSWTTEGLNAAFDAEYALDDTGKVNESFTPDLSRWFTGFGATVAADEKRVFERGLDGFVAPISPPLESAPEAPTFQGASTDHSHVFIKTSLSNNADARAIAYLSGDPEPAGAGEDHNAYVASLDAAGEPSIELLARDQVGADAGKAWGGDCGARLGGMESATGGNLNLPLGPLNQGAVSPDGSLVYFSTRPDHPDDGSDCVLTDKKRIMVREETPAGADIRELIESECTRVSPACSAADGDDIYLGASLDQTKVYFQTNRQLADSDLDGTGASCIGNAPPATGVAAVPGCDIYLYDSTRPAGERLTQVSAGDDATPGEGANVKPGIAAISADGSHVYFVAEGVLTEEPNPEGVKPADSSGPYLYTWDAANGETSYIGEVGPLDGGFQSGSTPGVQLWGGSATWSEAYPVAILSPDGAAGDGHLLFFPTSEPLTGDDADSVTDLYRYDAEVHSLERISIAGPGGSDDGEIKVDRPPSGGTGTDYAERGRWVSEDGVRAIFKTAEPLLGGDNNGLVDLYLWRQGEGIVRIPGATEVPGGSAIQLSMSHDGATIAFDSFERLTWTDGDSAQDVYVARADGGFPAPTGSACEGEACQGAPAPAPAASAAATRSLSGAGNLRPAARGCARQSRRAGRFSKRAKRLRRAAARSVGARRARTLRRRAQGFAKRAERQSAAAKRCRRANRRAAR